MITQLSASSDVGSTAGSNCANTCVVGQNPGHASGSVANVHVPNASLSWLAWIAIAPRLATAAEPVSPPGFTTGPNTSGVPAPSSNASPFIGCFEYSYDSTPLENPARSIQYNPSASK